MAAPLRLYLVRHGVVDANEEMRYLGRRDDPLNRTGRAQARRLGAVFAEIPVDIVHSSPLRRARDTAQCIADNAGVELRTDARLLEMDFGSWDGRTRSEVRDEDPQLLRRWEEDPTSVAPPGGESLAALQHRCLQFTQELLAQSPGVSAVLVAHVGPVKALLCFALGLPLSAQSRLFLDPATISVVDWKDPPVVRLVNDHTHLGWTNARWL